MWRPKEEEEADLHHRLLLLLHERVSSAMTEIRQRQTPTTTTTTNSATGSGGTVVSPPRSIPSPLRPTTTTTATARYSMILRRLRWMFVGLAGVLVLVPSVLVRVHPPPQQQQQHAPASRTAGAVLRARAVLPDDVQQQPTSRMAATSSSSSSSSTNQQRLPRIIFRRTTTVPQQQQQQQQLSSPTAPTPIRNASRGWWWWFLRALQQPRRRQVRPHRPPRVLTLPTEPLVVFWSEEQPSRIIAARTTELLVLEHNNNDDEDALLLLPEEQQRDEEEYGWDRTQAEVQQAIGQPVDCALPEWTHNMYPTCNVVHELDPVGPTTTTTTTGMEDSMWTETKIQKLGRGHYRTSYLYTSTTRTLSSPSQQQQQQPEQVVLKRLRVQRRTTQPQLQHIQWEAVLLGHYFASNPRMANLYVYCGGSVVVEPGQDVMADIIQPPWPSMTTGRNQSDDDDDDSRGFIPQSELDKLHAKTKGGLYIHNRKFLPDPDSKRHLALQMLESIALLHGFPHGPILHDDISLDQWLLSQIDGRVMLNDLNMVVPLQFSPSEGLYCRPPRSISGNFRAPETWPMHQSMGPVSDVWSMGAILYCILTGTYVRACVRASMEWSWLLE